MYSPRNKSVAVTWRMNVEQLSRPAREVMNMMSLMAPDGLPGGRDFWEDALAMVRAASLDDEDGAADDVGLEWDDADDVLSELEGLSLVRREQQQVDGEAPDAAAAAAAAAGAMAAGTWHMHRLLQMFARECMDGVQRGAVGAAVSKVLCGVLESRPHILSAGQRKALFDLVPHVESVMERVSREGGGGGGSVQATQFAARAGNAAAQLLKDVGCRYVQARQYHERSLAMLHEVHGGGDDAVHADIAKTLNNLGEVCRAQGDYAGARQYHEQSLAMKREVHGGGDDAVHADIATSLNNLGGVCEAQGDYAGARQYLEQALAMLHEVHGGGDDAVHADIAKTLNNLGEVCRAQGDYAGARQYHEQSLAMKREVHGGGDDAVHADIATSLNNLGGVCEAQGDYAGARQYYEQALAMYRQVHGSDAHPDVQQVQANIAAVDRKLQAAMSDPAFRRRQRLRLKLASRNTASLAEAARAVPAGGGGGGGAAAAVASQGFHDNGQQQQQQQQTTTTKKQKKKPTANKKKKTKSKGKKKKKKK